MRKYLYIAASAFVLSMGQAAAQSMDYGSLEHLFGEPITTSATGSPQRATEVPADMEIITADDIRRSGAQNISDLLEFVTGMSFRRYGTANTNVNVRGFLQPASPRLLVMINGRQVYLDDYGYVNWAVLPVQLSEIRQIEIVKGPASALFGFNAASGVINIITYDPLNDNMSVGQARVGTQNLAQGSAVLTHHFSEDFGVRLSGGIYREDDFGSVTANPAYQSVGLDSRWKATPHLEFNLEGTLAESRNNELIATGGLGETSYRTNSIKGGAVADTPLGLISASAYNNQLNSTNLTGLPTVSSVSDRVTVVQLSDLLKAGSAHTLRAAFEFRDGSSTASLAPGADVGEQIISGSAMWSWKIDRSLSLTNSVRVDHVMLYWNGPFPPSVGVTVDDYNRKTHTEFSYNSGLVYALSPNDTIRLLTGKGIQLPSLSVLGVVGPAVFPGVPAAITLEPSVVTNYEVAYDRKLPDLNSTLRLSVFHEEVSDLLELITFNAGSSYETGAEIGVKGSAPSGFRWNASYAYTTVTDHIASGAIAIGLNVLDFQHGTPRSVVNFGGGYSAGKIEADFEAHWQSSFRENVITSLFPPSGFVHGTGSYFDLSARLGYNLTDHLNLALSGAQLANSKQTQSAGPPVERRIFFTVTYRL
ncbi:MAG: TonB-dependent receptor [Alphaproteobacteria bacterium]